MWTFSFTWDAYTGLMVKVHLSHLLIVVLQLFITSNLTNIIVEQLFNTLMLNKKSWLALYNISSISQKQTLALSAGSISLYTACQECHISFSSAVRDVKISLQRCLKHFYLLSAPCVSYTSKVTVLYWKIKYDQHQLTLRTRTICPVLMICQKTTFTVQLELFVNVQSVHWFHSTPLYSLNLFCFSTKPENIICPSAI